MTAGIIAFFNIRKSDLLGALALGAKNVLALTGDSPRKGDHPDAKGVFEVNSCGLLEITEKLSPEFFSGAIINFSKNLDFVKKNVLRKKWAHRDLNPGHADYESAALTD